MNQVQPAIHPKIRLYVPQLFSAGGSITLGQGQSHYLANVMRVRVGSAIAIFNGSDGEWVTEVADVDRRSVTLRLQQCLRPQKNSPDIWLAFAPIKNKTDLVVEKAVELGVSKLIAVFTRHAVVRSINRDKLVSHAVEAAEQSERHDVPAIEEYGDLAAMLSQWPTDRTLLFADESGEGQDLQSLLPSLGKGRYGILVGPEGGFSPEERGIIRLCPMVKAFGLGPRILRADTASVAALACVQAWTGDWDEKPKFFAN